MKKIAILLISIGLFLAIGLTKTKTYAATSAYSYTYSYEVAGVDLIWAIWEVEYPNSVYMIDIYIPRADEYLMVAGVPVGSPPYTYQSTLEAYIGSHLLFSDGDASLIAEIFTYNATTGLPYSLDIYYLASEETNRIIIKILVDTSILSAGEFIDMNYQFTHEATFTGTLQSGFAYFYNGLVLYEQQFFNGKVSEPAIDPVHPKGYEFLYWELASGLRWNFDDLVTNLDLNEDSQLKLYARYAVPAGSEDVVTRHDNMPDGLASIFAMIGLDNESGYIFVFALLIVLLIIACVIINLPLTVTAIIMIALTGLFWWLSIIPFWICIIAIIIAVFLIIVGGLHYEEG